MNALSRRDEQLHIANCANSLLSLTQRDIDSDGKTAVD